MSYVLENEQESARLEKQATQGAYQISQELRYLQLQSGQRVLDAGCGTGLVARYLSNLETGSKIEGCDFSEARLQTAVALAKSDAEKKIEYRVSELTAIPVPDHTYDLVTCRYVIEHLAEPQEVVNELYRVTKKNGKVYLINFDGVIYNLHPMSPDLQDMMKILQQKLPYDSYAGRKLPDMLHQAGFKDIFWDVDVHSFRGEALQAEFEMNQERLTFAMPLLENALGSEVEAHRFKKLFLQEIMKPGATLFYNKFIAIGVK